MRANGLSREFQVVYIQYITGETENTSGVIMKEIF